MCNRVCAHFTLGCAEFDFVTSAFAKQDILMQAEGKTSEKNTFQIYPDQCRQGPTFLVTPAENTFYRCIARLLTKGYILKLVEKKTLLLLPFQELKNTESGQSKVDAAREQVFNQGLTCQMFLITLCCSQVSHVLDTAHTDLEFPHCK